MKEPSKWTITTKKWHSRKYLRKVTNAIHTVVRLSGRADYSVMFVEHLWFGSCTKASGKKSDLEYFSSI